jgi:glutamyl-tRNA synthetase
MLLTRFAPTPSGYLHVGNAFSFIITWLLARLQGGRILLRIDDLDNERFRPEYLEDIFYSLDWLGLDYDLGPSGVADFHAEWSQHRRIDLYRQLLAKLSPHLFACNCSRRTWQEASTDGLYPGTCIAKKLPLETDNAVCRLLTPDNQLIIFHEAGKVEPVQASPSKWMRHPVLRRKNGLPAYQVASVADDCHFGINLVVRGADLFASTVAQCYIAACIGEERFQHINFLHHPLLKDAHGEKLSKSAGSLALKTIAGIEKKPAKIYEMLSALLLPTEVPACSARELLERITVSKILAISNLTV